MLESKDHYSFIVSKHFSCMKMLTEENLNYNKNKLNNSLRKKKKNLKKRKKERKTYIFSFDDLIEEREKNSWIDKFPYKSKFKQTRKKERKKGRKEERKKYDNSPNTS